MDSIKEYLLKQSLFEGLNSEEIELLCNSSILKKYYVGNILFYEKEEQHSIYYLVQGELKVYKVNRIDNEIFLYNLFNGTLISEITDLDGSIKCFANAEFTKDSEVLIFNYKIFETIFHKNSKFMLNLIKEFAKKTKMLQCIINREIIFDGTAKVAFMLMTDLDKFNVLKKGEIAYMLNIQPETLSRILTKLFRTQIIQQSGQMIEIIKPNELKSFYE